MNYSIHLTNRCNLRCKYCYQEKCDQDISFDDIKNLINYQLQRNEKSSLINFFGGEPLLRKDLIKDTINYIKSLNEELKFYYGITTNGTLIDDEFINLVKKNNFTHVAYSFDGGKETQNLNRVFANDEGTFNIVEANVKKLLSNIDNVVAMPVITKNNISSLSKNVEYLVDLGFKKINLQFNYLDNWESEDLPEIEKQYNEVAKIYANKMIKEENIDIIAIDKKIKTYIQRDYNCNDDCKLGMKSVNVGVDGNFYPCVQFVGNEKYIIGNCKEGIDETARMNIIKEAKKEKDVCKKCSIRTRCKHTCACLNYMTMGDMNELSPLVCETEKIMVRVADAMAERLYKQNSDMFIQKFYNKNFDILNSIANKREEEK